jgi:hypothetical protein
MERGDESFCGADASKVDVDILAPIELSRRLGTLQETRLFGENVKI